MAELLEKVVEVVTANTTVTTTSETVAVTSGPVPVSAQTCILHVRAWFQMTSGTGATSITARLRRGATTGGTAIGEANLVTLAAAAGGNENGAVEAIDRRSDLESAQYSLTVEQAAASGNGTVLQAVIEVEVLSG